jgi:hypothetical protein
MSAASYSQFSILNSHEVRPTIYRGTKSKNGDKMSNYFFVDLVSA